MRGAEPAFNLRTNWGITEFWRSGDSLFPEYETVACEKLEHRTWQRVTREIQILDNLVHHKTKFEKIARYRCANLLYFVTVDGLIEPHELPSKNGGF
ncbi:MAG: hypothetical protein ACI8T1_001563 [Verrucomicrobiales bacterium]